MNDLKFTTAGDYVKDQEENQERNLLAENTQIKNTEEENESTMGREIPSKKD
jgi:hypothetical protein